MDFLALWLLVDFGEERSDIHDDGRGWMGLRVN